MVSLILSTKCSSFPRAFSGITTSLLGKGYALNLHTKTTRPSSAERAHCLSVNFPPLEKKKTGVKSAACSLQTNNVPFYFHEKHIRRVTIANKRLEKYRRWFKKKAQIMSRRSVQPHIKGGSLRLMSLTTRWRSALPTAFGLNASVSDIHTPQH